MTGPEHMAEAEALLAQAEPAIKAGLVDETVLVLAAIAHALIGWVALS